MFDQLLADAPAGDEGNHYSTSQIVETLNELICSCAEILFNNSTRFKAHIASLLAVFQTDHRKHLSNASLRDTQVAVFQAMVTNEFKPLKEIYMDRSFLFSAVVSMLVEVEQAAEIERKQLRKFSNKRDIELAKAKARLGMIVSPLLIMTSVNAWLNLYLDFRNESINRYIRLAHNHATAAKESSDITVDIRELTMNYILAINRAVDKCDLTKGTLTSYVQQWFLNAKTNADFNHEYGVSYAIPAAQRSKNTKLKKWHLQSNFALSIDDDSSEISREIDTIPDNDATFDFDRMDFDYHLLKKFRNIKKANLAFLSLQLPIILTPDEIALLKQQQIVNQT